jgi:hypothetical protein
MGMENYQRLYSTPIDDFDTLDKEVKNSFVFQGSKNWDMYLDKKENTQELSTFKNVILLDFSEKKEFEDYLRSHKIIDYSIEHVYDLKKYFVLISNG